MTKCYRFLPRFASAAAFAACLLLWPSMASAGVELRSTTTTYDGESEEAESTVTLAQDGNLRIDLRPSVAGAAPRHSTIYRGTQGDFLIVDHGEKSFTLLDEVAIEDLKARLQYTILQLDRQMAELPPQQRRRMRDALESSTGPTEDYEIVPTERREEKNGIKSRLYEFRRGQELVREVWVAPWSEIVGAEELRASLENLQSFSSQLEEAFSSLRSEALGGAQIFQMGDNPYKDFKRLGGLPVHTVEYEDGEKRSETQVLTISDREVSRQEFLPPQSYRRQAWSD